MIANKTMCRLKQSILYLTFLLWKFADTVLVTFVDTLSEAFTISSSLIFGTVTLLGRSLRLLQLLMHLSKLTNCKRIVR